MTTERLVCVIDDDDAVRDSLRLLLETQGVAVTGFSSGQDFLQYRPAQASLVLVDFQMPIMDGVAMLRNLRQQGVMTPAILITANALPRSRALAGANVTAVLRKPVSEIDLLHWIARIFSAEN